MFTSLAAKLATGAGIGGALGGLSSIGDGEDDTFKDIGVGAGFGLAGTGGLLGSMRAMKRFPRWGLTGAVGSIGLGAGGAIGKARNFDYSAQPDDSEVGKGILSGLGSAVGSLQSLIDGAAASDASGRFWDLSDLPPWMRDQNSYYGGFGGPDISTKSRAQWLLDPDLNKAANSQIIGANAATMREIEGIKKRRDIELEQNSELSKEYQAHANRIQAEDIDGTKAIMDHAADRSAAITGEADAMLDETNAALAGNNHERAEFAASNAEQEARLAEARLSDAKLLERLGIGSQTILQDMAAAEGIQSKNQSVAIRTSAADAITEKNRETADRWKFDKPTIMQSLVDGAMNQELQQRQLGLSAYQMKMQQAADMRRQQQQYFENQQKMQMEQQAAMAQGAGGIGAAQLYGDSGLSFKNPNDDSPVNIPEFATWPVEQAVARGVPQETWEFWQSIIAANAEALGLGG